MFRAGFHLQVAGTALAAAAAAWWAGRPTLALPLAAIAVAGGMIELVPAVVRRIRHAAGREPSGIVATSYGLHRVRYRDTSGVRWVHARDVLAILDSDDEEAAVRRLGEAGCRRFEGSRHWWLSARGVDGLLGRRLDAEARRLHVWLQRTVFASTRRR